MYIADRLNHRFNPTKACDDCLYTLCWIAGFKMRKRQITNEPTGGLGNCPHLVEAVPCDEPSCYNWKLVGLDKCIPDDEKQCGPGTQVAQVQCINSNGKGTSFNPTVSVDHLIWLNDANSVSYFIFSVYWLTLWNKLPLTHSSLHGLLFKPPLFARMEYRSDLAWKILYFQGHLSTDPPALVVQCCTWGDFHYMTPGCHLSTFRGILSTLLSLKPSFLSPC